MTVSRDAKRGVVALGAGLLTFLVLASGADDKGDEFIYGLIVAAIAWWVSGKIFSLPPRKET